MAYFYALGYNDQEKFEKMDALFKSYSSEAKIEDKINVTVRNLFLFN